MIKCDYLSKRVLVSNFTRFTVLPDFSLIIQNLKFSHMTYFAQLSMLVYKVQGFNLPTPSGGTQQDLKEIIQNLY